MKHRVAILGNFNPNYQPHFSMNEHFKTFGESFEIDWVPTETLAGPGLSDLTKYSGIVAGSGPYKSKEGIINGIRYARENNIPFLGTCSGFGYAVLEFGQSLFKLPGVHHPYEIAGLPDNEIFLQPLEFCSSEIHTISFMPVAGTQTDRIYGQVEIVHEESHCYYGVNRKMIDRFKEGGLTVSGLDENGEPKIMEYSRNDFFIITLFLPQLQKKPQNLHPLFSAYFDAIEKRAVAAC
jgi:CTP synthase (UTP-ammonia lyase)